MQKFEKIFNTIIEIVILVIIGVLSTFTTLYFLNEKGFISQQFNKIKNFILDYNVFIIHQENLKVITQKGDEVILGYNSKNDNTILSGYNKNVRKDLIDLRYIKVNNGEFPIIDVLKYKMFNNSNASITDKIDELINFGIIMKYKNIILTHSSGKGILGKYWIWNFKQGSNVVFENMIGDKIKYKVKKIFIIPKKQYKNDFTFYKDKIYLVTCYPIGTNKKRWIAVLEKTK